MKLRCSLATLSLLPLALVPSARAETISVNFTDTAGDDMLPADIAGFPDAQGARVANWNNVLASNSGSAANMVDSSGAATTMGFSYTTNLNRWRIGHTIDGSSTGDDKMWKGYLDVAGGDTNTPGATIAITGIPFTGPYDVFVYFDGDNGGAWRIANYEVVSGTGVQTAFGEDSEDCSWGVAGQENQNKVYQIPAPGANGNAVWPITPNNSEGNTIRFTNVSGASITLKAWGGTGVRAPINGFQLVQSGDTDGDGLPNSWEILNGLDPASAVGNDGATGDPDADGSNNLRELNQNSNPQNPDTDADSLLDGVETGTGIFVSAADTGTKPTDTDSDDDGLTDTVENNSGTYASAASPGSNPNKLDTDNDTLPDGWEANNNLNPNDNGSVIAANGANGDPDGETLVNSLEFARGTNPQNPDTDGDTLTDKVESNSGVFVGAADTGTSPLRTDTDNDLYPDNVETNTGVYVSPTNTGTNPNLADTDSDGFTDYDEVALGTNPFQAGSAPVLPLAIGYWPLNDQAATTDDVSPGDHNGDLNGAPLYVAGHSALAGDFAIDFDGLDDSVTTGASILNGLNAFTMSGWIKMPVQQTANRIGLFGQNDVVEFGMINPTTLEQWVPNGGAIQNAIGGVLEGWTHIAVTASGGARTLYVNGGSVATGTLTNSATSTFGFNIGGGGVFDTTGNFFLGQIDDVAVWRQALTPAQISELAAMTLSPAQAVPSLPPSNFFITSISRAANGDITLIWPSQVTRTYTILYSEDLTTASTPVPGQSNLQGEAGSMTRTFASPSPGSTRLYFKVKEQ